MRQRGLKWLGIWVLAGGVLFLGYQRYFSAQVFNFQSFIFNTLVEVRIYGQNEAQAEQHAQAVWHELERLYVLLSAYAGNGELARLNQALMQGQFFPASDEMLALLFQVQQKARDFPGFEPGIGRLIQLWGFHDSTSQRKAGLPLPSEVASLVSAQPSILDLVQEGNRVGVPGSTAVKLDLGGVAKGYALDRVRDLLWERQVKNALINIGGNVLAMGKKGAHFWKVGLQHPREARLLATLDLLPGEAVGTSGDYQRYFIQDGQRYCHLINPKSGYPVQHTAAVVVVAPRNLQAGINSDVWTKPLFLASAQEWEALAQQLGIEFSLRVDVNGETQVLPKLAERLTWE